MNKKREVRIKNSSLVFSSVGHQENGNQLGRGFPTRQF